MENIFILLVFGGMLGCSTAELVIVDREGWHAKPAKLIEPMDNPVPYVIIHHSYLPKACHTRKACIRAMQSMQNFHQDDRGWNDIGYSFAVGGDGAAYEGRGWSAVGAHAPRYNNRSIGICVIGDWTAKLPPLRQLETVAELIRHGVHRGKIGPDYVLLGHRQVRDTECPGDALFEEISKWPHFAPKPPSCPPESSASGEDPLIKNFVKNARTGHFGLKREIII